MGIFVFDVIKAFSDTLKASVDAVVGSVTDLSTTTDTSVANLQNFTISTQAAGGRKPAWISPYPISDVTYPDAMNFLLIVDGTTTAQSAGTAHTHGGQGTLQSGPWVYHVNLDDSLGATITVTDPLVGNTVGMYLWKVGTVTSAFIDVFHEDASSTAMTRVASVAINGTLTTSPALVLGTISNVIGQPGDKLMVRIRNAAGGGSINMAALVRTVISPNTSFYTTGTSLTAQTSYTAGQVTTARSGTDAVPFAVIANAGATTGDVSYSDDFNRSQFGGLWLLISSWATQLGVTSSMAAYQGTTNGDQQALFIRSTSGDGSRVDFDVTGSAVGHHPCAVRRLHSRQPGPHADGVSRCHRQRRQHLQRLLNSL
jgi:hypothetical protein